MHCRPNWQRSVKVLGMDGEKLKSRLRVVRGRVEANYPLADLTWFRVGGPAEVLYTPADEADLADFMAGLPEDVPYYVIGVGSNLLVRDGGIPGHSTTVSFLPRALAPFSNRLETRDR